MEAAQINFERSMEKLADDYRKYQKNCEEEYQTIQADMAQDLSEQIDANREQMDKFNAELSSLQETVKCAVAAAKRLEEIKTQVNFYKINLTEDDLQEIAMLQKITPYIRDKEAVNKVIWKCYYEKPTTDLIGRVIGSGAHTGIYKITHIESEKCYVGQAVDLASRWKQHIKRGLGAEPATRNKLYPAMMEYGPESFTFEILEECDKSLLDEREDFWQEYYMAKEFGYSIK
jgi:hypothetical protein